MTLSRQWFNLQILVSQPVDSSMEGSIRHSKQLKQTTVPISILFWILSILKDCHLKVAFGPKMIRKFSNFSKRKISSKFLTWKKRLENLSMGYLITSRSLTRLLLVAINRPPSLPAKTRQSYSTSDHKQRSKKPLYPKAYNP